jgi:tetratricopeptide (TPR) repeat protein
LHRAVDCAFIDRESQKEGTCMNQTHSRGRPVFALALIVGLALVSGGCDRFRSPHVRGVRSLKAGNYDRAIEAFTAAIADAQGAGDVKAEAIALANRCYARDAAGQQGEAIADCTRSLELAPDDPEVLNNRGVAYLNDRKLDEAEADLDAAIKLRPDYAQAYANRGRLFADREDYAGARADLDKAIELDGTLAQAYANRAFVHDSLGEIEAAVDDYSKAIERSRDPDTYFNRGMLYYRYARFDEAYEDFRVAADLDPDGYIGYMARTQADFLRNRPSQVTPAATGGPGGTEPDAVATAPGG